MRNFERWHCRIGWRPGEKREVPEIVELLRLEIQDLSEDMTANAWMNND